MRRKSTFNRITGNNSRNRIFANGLFSYDHLEPRNLLAAVIGSESYVPQPIVDPFVQDAVTYKDMVDRASVNPYMPGELIVAISANQQGLPVHNYVESIKVQTFGRDFLKTYPVDSTRTMMTVQRDSGTVELVHLEFADDMDVFSAMAKLDDNPSVLWSAPNFYQTESPLEYTPNDPEYPNQYHHTLMSNDLAWDTTLGDPNIIVGITDDGFELTHEDLSPNIYVNPGETPGDGIDNDGNGYIDDVNGWDFINGNNDANPDLPSHSHGTHVAGIAAGRTDNNVGIAGTAGGATILPLKFYNYGSWPASVINESFVYAVDNGAKIVSTSYNIDGWVGDPVFTAGMQYMYDNGVLPINSAGNAGSLNPTRQAFNQTILVASSDSDDSLSSFTNYGTGIDIVAPGGSILSSVTGNAYALNSGTSMAAPNAAGVAALIWSAHPTWTRDQVAAQLVGTADNIDAENPTRVGLMGGGRANSGAGVTATLAAPQLDSIVGLPDDGAFLDDTTIDTFTVRFDQIMDPASINNASNFELLNAGEDGVFETEDDFTHSLSYNTYMISSNELVFDILDGPMDYGVYRFTIKSDGVKNPFNNPLDGNGDGTGGDDYVREFHIAPPVIGELAFDSSGYTIADTINISVIDGNAAATIEVTITTEVGDSETLTLNGVGSLYTASIVTAGGAATIDDGQLQVTLGETITATYQDLDDGTGNPVTVTATAIINNIKEYPSTDTPLPITDNSAIVSTITITDGGVLTDFDLQLDITHTWDGDLDATLTAPDGSSYVLFDRIGGSGDNFDDTYFDDDAAQSINDGTAPFSGIYRPQDAFAPLNGTSITGDWTLRIMDNAGLDQGSLNYWTLFMNVEPPSPFVGEIMDINSAADEVSEDAQIGDEVGITVQAIDPTPGDEVIYSLTENAGGRFSIDEASGVVTVSSMLDYETGTGHIIEVLASSTDGSTSTASFVITVLNVDDAVITGRHMFYQGSSFDGSDDFDSVAIDKNVLRTGETATFDNYSTYWKGLNGLVLEVNDFNRNLTAFNYGNFIQFKVGNDNTPADWATAPTPTSVSIQENVDASGTDRLYVTWADNDIQNQWLQVVVLANEWTGLATTDVFYMGNVIGETGNSSTNAIVNLQDVAFARLNQTGFGSAAIDNAFDFNRDGKVNLLDVGIARTNLSGFSPVNLITPGATEGFAFGKNDSSKSIDQFFGSLASDNPVQTPLESDQLKRWQPLDETELSQSLILSGSQVDSSLRSPVVTSDYDAQDSEGSDERAKLTPLSDTVFKSWDSGR